jgi:hypothetical protein
MTQKYLLTFPPIDVITDLIPDINQILPSFTNPFSLPPYACIDLGFPYPATNLLPAIPDLSTMAADFNLHMPDIQMPSFSSMYAAAGVLLSQIVMVINSLWSKVKQALSALGGGYGLAMPEWPGFPDFSLSDLVALNPLPLLANISMPDFDFSIIPDLPTLTNFISPAMEIFHALQCSAADFMALIVDKIASMVSSICSLLAALELGSFSLDIPSIPTYDQLMAMLPPLPTLSDLNSLSIPQFPDFSLPDPILPDFHIPTFEFSYGITQMIMSMLGSNVKKIVDLCESFPLWIGEIFTGFPKIPDWIGPMPAVPSVCHESVNSGIQCFT